MNKFRSIRTKILASFLGVFLLSVSATGLTNYVFTRNHLEESQKNEMKSSVHHMRQMLLDDLHNRMHILKRISETRELREYVSKHRDIPLKNKMEGHKNLFPVIKFINTKGVEEIKLVNGNVSEELRDVSAALLLKEAIKKPKEVVLSGVEANPDLGEPAINIGIAVKGNSGDGPGGMLAGAIPLSVFSNRLSGPETKTKSFLILTDGDGRILHHADHGRILEIISGDGKELVAEAAAHKSGFRRANVMGIDGYYAYASIGNNGWALITGLPYEEFIAAPNIARNTALVAFILTSLLGTMVAFLLSRGITRPLQDLAGATKKIAEGDYGDRLGVSSDDEVGTVIEAFNKMSETLQKTVVSRDYVDNILHSMHDVLIVTDAEGAIKRVNKAALEALEYSDAELIGQPVEKIFSDESSCDAPDIVSRDEIYSTIETDYVTKSGNKIPVVFTSSVMLDKAGKVQGIVCVAQDITERKCMEESLRSSEDYFRSFVESSQDCICNLTVDGRLMSMNPAGCALNDTESAEEVTGMSCMANVVSGREAVEEALTKAAKGAKTSVEYKTVSGKGREVWWDCKFAPVEDIDGSIRSILQVSRDISAHKNLEQSLLRAQDMLIKEHDELSRLFRQVELSKTEWESTMDCMGDMIILTDRKGKIKRFNKQLLKFTDKPLAEIVGREWEEIMSEIGLETVTFYSGSVELLHRPSHKWFTLNSYPLKDSASDLSGAVITVHETTEIKNITEELETAYKELKDTQAQILQREKMASIGQLAAGVAHEINNPMGFITSNLGTLDKYINKLTEYIDAQAGAVASFKSEEAEAGLKEIRKKLKLDYVIEDIGQLIGESLEGAERVKKIVQNLKTFSRVDQAEHKPADINECIESTLNIVWNELKYKTTVEKEYGKLPSIKCYPQQLNQVFMNLLVNAAQAIEKQGTIKIKTWNGDGSINISISDTGDGIPADKINKIFDPFFTTKPVGKGTGLGLSITYDIVKRHNGEITVDSEVGKGTVFNIRIPVVEGK